MYEKVQLAIMLIGNCERLLLDRSHGPRQSEIDALPRTPAEELPLVNGQPKEVGGQHVDGGSGVRKCADCHTSIAKEAVECPKPKGRPHKRAVARDMLSRGHENKHKENLLALGVNMKVRSD